MSLDDDAASITRDKESEWDSSVTELKGVSHDKWRWGAEEEEHMQQIEKKPCRQQKYRQRTDKEANVSKDRLINETIRSDGIKTNK